jgi:hypothetical protein
MFNNFHSSPNTVTVIKSKRMMRGRANRTHWRDVCKISVEKSDGHSCLRDLDVESRLTF